METLAQVIVRQEQLEARLLDMIACLEGPLFVMSVAMLHLANGNMAELKETATQAKMLLTWRDQEARHA
jgi:hypothetical protein